MNNYTLDEVRKDIQDLNDMIRGIEKKYPLCKLEFSQEALKVVEISPHFLYVTKANIILNIE